LIKILFVLASYLLGALPSGYIVYSLSEGKDIRHFGSGATGTTNIFRLKGWKHAVPVLILDLFKGFLPPFLALQLFGDERLALVSAFFSVLGHCYPVYIKFKGGKGVATTIGAFAALAFLPLLIGLAVFLLTLALSRHVSMGSLFAAFSLMPAAYFLSANREIVFLATALFLLITLRHKENIQRLIQGTEREFGRREQ